MSKTFATIQSQTLNNSSTSTVTFSSIPQTFTDLFFICHVRSADSTTGINIRFNGDSASNYAASYFLANNSSVTTAAYIGHTSILATGFSSSATVSGSSNFSPFIFSVLSYSSSVIKKTTVGQAFAFNSTSDHAINISNGAWDSTNAINSVSLIGTGNFAAGSVFSLYGIKNE